MSNYERTCGRITAKYISEYGDNSCVQLELVGKNCVDKSTWSISLDELDDLNYLMGRISISAIGTRR